MPTHRPREEVLLFQTEFSCAFSAHAQKLVKAQGKLLSTQRKKNQFSQYFLVKPTQEFHPH